MVKKLGIVITVLLVGQVVFSLFVVGRYVLFGSSLPLWLNQDYFEHQKTAMMLGGDYVIGQQLKDLPENTNLLAVSSETLWFINYYLAPRKLYYYEGVTDEASLLKVPPAWFREKKIDYVLHYHQPKVWLSRVGVK